MGDQERGVDWVDYVDQMTKDGAHKTRPPKFFHDIPPPAKIVPTPVPPGTTVTLMERDPYHGVVTKKTVIKGDEPWSPGPLLTIALVVVVTWLLHRFVYPRLTPPSREPDRESLP